jgi:hypothetical protein
MRPPRSVGGHRAVPFVKPTLRSRSLAVIASAVLLAACAGDEKEGPEAPTNSSPTLTVHAPFTTQAPTVAVTATSEPVTATTITTVAAPPVTCGPDPDETHPPPCD